MAGVGPCLGFFVTGNVLVDVVWRRGLRSNH
jgi:hypothetical protein